MSASADAAVAALNNAYFAAHPRAAARDLEALSAKAAAAVARSVPRAVLARVLDFIGADAAAELIAALPEVDAAALLAGAAPNRAVTLLAQLEGETRDRLIAALPKGVAGEIRRLLAFPENTAGRLMDTRFIELRGEMTAAEALARIRRTPERAGNTLYIVDGEGKLRQQLTMRDLAIADHAMRLARIASPVTQAVLPTAPREEVVEALTGHRMANLPVVDLDGRLVGVIRYAALLEAVEDEATVDIQTMVGASRDERALSSPLFTVRKRLPWLEINLLTAFLAASVVGIFESTIAKYTALAVLLPVVAGQSGNAGSQALAVTMRGLALREIATRHWLRVAAKEMSAGFVNGVAIAVTTAAGVLVWSQSIGLALVIGISMVISMVIAGLSGALVPIVLTKTGQDPAVGSSIVLTTVTDIAGFMSFLGIATGLGSMLQQGG